MSSFSSIVGKCLVLGGGKHRNSQFSCQAFASFVQQLIREIRAIGNFKSIRNFSDLQMHGVEM